jgi:Domain of unknown function (DUF4328)
VGDRGEPRPVAPVGPPHGGFGPLGPWGPPPGFGPGPFGVPPGYPWPPPGYFGPQPMPWIDPRLVARADLDSEERSARWAKFALVALSVGLLAASMTFVLWYPEWIRKVADIIRTTPDGQTPVLPTAPGSPLTGFLGLGLILAMVVVVMWTHRVVRLSRNLHYPNARSAVWAAAGWVVPLLNFWFPYQGVRDAVPPGDPARRQILKWWVSISLTIVFSIAAAVAGWFSKSVGLALCLPLGIAAGLAAQHGQEVVDAVLDHHHHAIGKVTGGPANRPG